MTKVPQKTWNRNVWGILNADGAPWTPTTFDTKADGEAYLAEQQAKNPTWTLGKHTVKRVSVTVRAITFLD